MMNQDFLALKLSLAMDRKLHRDMAEHHEQMAQRCAPEGVPWHTEQAAERHGWADQADRQIRLISSMKEALERALPTLSEALTSYIEGEALFDQDHRVRPGSLTGEAVDWAREDLGVVQAVAEALGEELPAELQAVLPALPPAPEQSDNLGSKP